MALANSGSSAHFSCKKYSTALTSWFVVDSIVLIRSASLSPKLPTIAFKCSSLVGENAGNSPMS